MNNNNELLKSEAERILAAAKEAGFPIRLLGGMAVYISSPCTIEEPYARTINDLDFVVSNRKSYNFGKLLEKIGFEGNHEFNSIHGESRMLFHSELLEIDVFVGAFEQCHKIDLEKHFGETEKIIPLSDLLLTKLQIVQINQKDILDILSILHDHAVANEGNAEEVIKLDSIISVVSNDWGWYTTVMDNFEKVSSYIKEHFKDDEQKMLLERIEQIRCGAEAAPKSIKWKLRDKIGRKVQWYNLPEEK